jgi:hypothetical protein
MKDPQAGTREVTLTQNQTQAGMTWIPDRCDHPASRQPRIIDSAMSDIGFRCILRTTQIMGTARE